MCLIHSLVPAGVDSLCWLGASLKRLAGLEKVPCLACLLELLLGKQWISFPSAAFAYALVPLLGIGLSELSRTTLKTHFSQFWGAKTIHWIRTTLSLPFYWLNACTEKSLMELPEQKGEEYFGHLLYGSDRVVPHPIVGLVFPPTPVSSFSGITHTGTFFSLRQCRAHAHSFNHRRPIPSLSANLEIKGWSL